MAESAFRHRLARHDDLPALSELMELAIAELQKPFLGPAEIASSRALMGLDTQLIEDGTYFVVEQGGTIAGCGGWSRRRTMYGGDRSPGRNAALLEPATEPARVRAMYTHPRFVRRGVGRLILALCEDAARGEDSRAPSWSRPSPASRSTAPAATRPSNALPTSGAAWRCLWSAWPKTFDGTRRAILISRAGLERSLVGRRRWGDRCAASAVSDRPQNPCAELCQRA